MAVHTTRIDDKLFPLFLPHNINVGMRMNLHRVLITSSRDEYFAQYECFANIYLAGF